MQSSSYINLNETFEKTTKSRNNNARHMFAMWMEVRGGGARVHSWIIGFHWMNAYAASIQK